MKISSYAVDHKLNKIEIVTEPIGELAAIEKLGRLGRAVASDQDVTLTATMTVTQTIFGVQGATAMQISVVLELGPDISTSDLNAADEGAIEFLEVEGFDLESAAGIAFPHPEKAE